MTFDKSLLKFYDEYCSLSEINFFPLFWVHTNQSRPKTLYGVMGTIKPIVLMIILVYFKKYFEKYHLTLENANRVEINIRSSIEYYSFRNPFSKFDKTD